MLVWHRICCVYVALPNGRNDLKKPPTLEEEITLPITVPFTLSPEVKGI